MISGTLRGDERGDEKGDVSPRNPPIVFDHLRKNWELRVENFDSSLVK